MSAKNVLFRAVVQKKFLFRAVVRENVLFMAVVRENVLFRTVVQERFPVAPGMSGKETARAARDQPRCDVTFT